MQVLIDGKAYIPRDEVISEKTLANLSAAYCLAWGFGVYDPYHDCDATNHLREIAQLLSEANKELKFKA